MSNGEMVGPEGKFSNGFQPFSQHSSDLKQHHQQQQQQQQGQKPASKLGDLISQNQMNFNNMNALQNLNEMLMQTSKMNQQQQQQTMGASHRASFGQQSKMNPLREVGAIEKILNGYGFIKSLNRENGLFFQYNNSQNLFKVGDIVEFNESVDKNNKPIGINLVKVQSNEMPKINQQMNLKDLLLNPQAQNNQVYSQQQQNYENFLNDLKQFKIQQQAQESQNLNNLISLFNKENMFQQSNQGYQASMNQQNNIFNMAKLSGLHQSNSLPDFKNICSEFIEGTIAIPANQQQVQFVS
jgi:hypothetical protein